MKPLIKSEVPLKKKKMTSKDYSPEVIFLIGIPSADSFPK